MKLKFVYTLLCEYYFATIFLLIMISLVDLAQLAAEPTTRECDLENPLCEHCNQLNKSLCRVCKNITMCSELVTKRYVKCLSECPDGYFYKLTREQRFCCQPCSTSCLNGCTGNQSTIGKKGCNKCKYAILNDSKQYSCLDYSLGGEICPRGFYAEKSKKTSITEFECKKCHKNCERCSSDGNDIDEDDCICASGAEIATETRNNSIHRVCALNPDHTVIDFDTTTKKPQKTKLPKTQNVVTTRSTAIFETTVSPTDKINWIFTFGMDKNVIFLIVSIILLICFISLGFLIYIVKCYKIKRYKDKKNTFGKLMSSDSSANEQLLQPSQIFGTKLQNIAPIVRMESIAGSPPSSSTTIESSQMTQSNGNIFFSESMPLETTSSNAPSINKLNIITKEEIKILNKINEGQFGIVYKGMYKNQPVAIKKSKIQDSEAIKEAVDESTFMVRHFHQHIQKLLGVCHFDGFMIVSELRKGNLKSFLRSNRDNLNINNLLLFCTQISAAVEFLHSLNKIHGDLAARNVLVKAINHVEIGDFGLSKALKRDQTGYKNSGKAAGRWLSPECLRTWIFDKPNDVWAFGVTCWEIFTLGSKLPYEDQKLETNQEKRAHLERLENGYKLPQPTVNENDCVDEYAIMLRCWAYPASGRANIQQVLESFKNLLLEIQPLYSQLGSNVYQ